MSAQERQLWVNGAPRFCKHAWEEVRSEDGTRLYGERCRRCGASWAFGRCDGCERPRARLTLSLPSGRYCDADCADIAEKRRQTASRKEAREGPEPWVCRHQHTEGVLAEGGHLIGVVCMACGKAFPGAGP